MKVLVSARFLGGLFLILLSAYLQYWLLYRSHLFGIDVLVLGVIFGIILGCGINLILSIWLTNTELE